MAILYYLIVLFYIEVFALSACWGIDKLEKIKKHQLLNIRQTRWLFIKFNKNKEYPFQIGKVSLSFQIINYIISLYLILVSAISESLNIKIMMRISVWSFGIYLGITFVLLLIIAFMLPTNMPQKK